jgi:hypothetical protein
VGRSSDHELEGTLLLSRAKREILRFKSMKKISPLRVEMTLTIDSLMFPSIFPLPEAYAKLVVNISSAITISRALEEFFPV